MYLNRFSVRVVGGSEREGGYVNIPHGRQYSLQLRNARNVRCDAQVQVDGKDVGTFRIEPHSSITLERPVNDEGRFTAYRPGTEEARAADINPHSPDLGLIKVTFTPEFPPPTFWENYSKTMVKKLEPTWRGSSATVNTANDQYTHTGMTGTLGDANENLTLCAFAAPADMGTGLSGHSNQKFFNVAPLNYDYGSQTTIHLRLVWDDGPRPLVSTSNPIPPRVG